MKLRHHLSYFSLLCLSITFSACKKTKVEPASNFSIAIEPSVVNITSDQVYVGMRLALKLNNVPAGETGAVIWTVEDPKIARVTTDGVVWPVGGGETYVLATLVSGRGVGKCKVIVSDGNDYKYRLVLKDKGTSNFSISEPEKFLSPKAIQRRLKRNISIDASDLPISPDYLKAIANVGGTIVAKSKWLNTVSVNCTDQYLIEKYKALPFVKDVILVWKGKRITTPAKYADVPQLVSNHTSDTHFNYGTALTNISVNNGQVLHQQGFKGAGIDIAVLDNGFVGMKSNSAFNNVNIKGARSFVYENADPYAVGTHGVWVTSCMAVKQPGKFVGTAPEANYWLLRTEDDASEFPIEEDYWVSGAEFADSVGVDMINSSLGYSTYDLPSATYKFEDMNGNTAFATRGANFAASKGILLVVSAGNDNRWVGTPADSPNVLTIGSVNKTLNIDQFSSWGITVDGRMKPDVLALGGGASVIGIAGIGETKSGTSFASPNICGLIACLWQAYPNLTNKQMQTLVRKSGNRSAQPITPFGYGIANMQKAMELATTNNF